MNPNPNREPEESEKELEVKAPRVDHPIVASFIAEVVADVHACNCDDYEVCEYEACDK